MKSRLDAELVRRGLARSRDIAAQLIESGQVLVNGIAASKAATGVDWQTSIKLKDEHDEFVSRGGHKLAGALDHFSELKVSNLVALDAGASTGGFTDVLLKRGVTKVVAVDVGYGQLAWELQSLSFISLKLVLPALISVAKSEATFLVMVKPQFEVGKEKLGAGGVVRDAHLRKEAVWAVAEAALSLGLGCKGVVASTLPGPAGNVEYFLWLQKGAAALLEVDLDLAIEKGPA